MYLVVSLQENEGSLLRSILLDKNVVSSQLRTDAF